MFEYRPDHRLVFYTADDPHSVLALWTDQGINFIYLLNQPCPAFPECLFVTLWFKDAGDSIIAAFLLPFSPCDVAVKAIIFHHLLAPIRDVRAHSRQLRAGETMVIFLSLAV